jgi:hypothetical protein
LSERSGITLFDKDRLTVVRLLRSNLFVLLVFRQVLDLDFSFGFPFSSNNLDGNPIRSQPDQTTLLVSKREKKDMQGEGEEEWRTNLVSRERRA